MSELKIELLFWQGCPSYMEAMRRLREVMAELDIKAPVKEIEVASDKEAERLRFPGSPTIRVNGVDIDPIGADQAVVSLTCRVYRLEDGRFSGVPSKEMIYRALSQVAGNPVQA